MLLSLKVGNVCTVDVPRAPVDNGPVMAVTDAPVNDILYICAFRSVVPLSVYAL